MSLIWLPGSIGFRSRPMLLLIHSLDDAIIGEVDLLELYDVSEQGKPGISNSCNWWQYPLSTQRSSNREVDPTRHGNLPRFVNPTVVTIDDDVQSHRATMHWHRNERSGMIPIARSADICAAVTAGP